MPEEMDLIKLNAIKRYIKDIKSMRISSSLADELRIRINDILKKIISESVSSAKKDNRSTILARDLDPAIEAELGKKTLNPNDLFKSIKILNPIALGDLSKLITAYIEAEKKKKDE
jgi:histone H3/H4